MMLDTFDLTRRKLVTCLGAITAVALAGCGQAGNAQSGSKSASPQKVKPIAATTASMTVYRDPSCGCCEAWASIARSAGYQVNVIDHPDVPAIKAKLGVPDALASCHTATVGGYAVEGHVPLADVARLLEEMPKDVRGIAVAGMPRGSPGMEMPDGSKDAFRVMAFDGAGNMTIF